MDALEHMFLELYLALVLMTIDITALADVAGRWASSCCFRQRSCSVRHLCLLNMFGRNYGRAVHGRRHASDDLFTSFGHIAFLQM